MHHLRQTAACEAKCDAYRTALEGIYVQFTELEDERIDLITFGAQRYLLLKKALWDQAAQSQQARAVGSFTVLC